MSSQLAAFATMNDRSGMPEESESKFPEGATILEEGASKLLHFKHKYVEMKWDPNRFGHSAVTDFGDYMAAYHDHLKCKRCGREIVHKKVAMI